MTRYTAEFRLDILYQISDGPWIIEGAEASVAEEYSKPGWAVEVWPNCLNITRTAGTYTQSLEGTWDNAVLCAQAMNAAYWALEELL